jgi:hypothetical protein
MYTGKHFRLKLDILGIEVADGNRIATTIPAGQTIRVLSGPRPDDRRMVDVLWGERTLVMFTEDLERRGEEIRSARYGVTGNELKTRQLRSQDH